MYRVAIEKLLKWKQSKRRKPLIIEGARQVGKTWLMKEFGRQSYADTVYINFDSNSRMAELFASDLDTDRLIMGLELYVGHKIDPNNSLLVFDEVQEVPRALGISQVLLRKCSAVSHCMRRFFARYRLASRHVFPCGQGRFPETISSFFQGVSNGNRQGAICRASG